MEDLDSSLPLILRFDGANIFAALCDVASSLVGCGFKLNKSFSAGYSTVTESWEAAAFPLSALIKHLIPVWEDRLIKTG